jgi:hypothetical protein
MNDELPGQRPEPDDAALRQLAARLGVRAADRVDPAAVGRVVVARLRAPAVVPLAGPVRRRSPVWLRLAAVLVVLAGTGVVARRLLPVPDPAPRLVADDLTDLGADQLTELLGSLDQALGGAAAPPDDGLDDLDAEQLERVLRAMEG